MGILHDLLDKIHHAHDNALQLADPARAKTEAHHGFFQMTADLVHSLEARIEAVEHALFGSPEPAQAAAPAPAPAPVEVPAAAVSAVPTPEAPAVVPAPEATPPAA